MSVLTRIRIWPRVAASGAAVAVFLAGGSDHRPYHDGAAHYQAGIVAHPRFEASISFDDDGWGARAVPTAAAIGWMPAEPARLDGMAALYWRDATIEVDRVANGVVTRRLTGTVAEAAIDGGMLRITCADLAQRLDKPFAPATFDGTGGIEGGDFATGRPKRRSFGRVWNVEGRLLDQANNIYEFGDPSRPLLACTALRDKGRAGALGIVAWQGSIAATLAALKAAVPVRGGGVFAPSIACAKWWTQPAGPLTADLQGEAAGYAETPAGIAAQLLVAAGGPAISNLAAAVALRPGVSGLHIGDTSETTASALDRLLQRVTLLWTVTPAGSIEVRQWTFSGPVEALNAVYIGRESTMQPVKSRQVGYRKNERQHGESEISIALQAEDVVYEDGTTAEDLKPAEKDATNGAPEGTTVAGTPAEQLVADTAQAQIDIAAAQEQVAELIETYGTTAAASASAAQTAATIAEQAAANAQSAMDDAEAAFAGSVTASAAALAARTAAETARDLAVTAKADAEAAFANSTTARDAAVAARTAAETARDLAVTAKTDAQTAFANSTTARDAAIAARTAAETARDLAVTAKTDAQTAFANSTTARDAALAAKTASELARDNAQASATNAGNSATAASGFANTASTKATEAGNSATAAAASAVSAASNYSSAVGVVIAALPERYAAASDPYFSASVTGAPATNAPLIANFTSDDGYPVRSITISSGTSDWAQRGVFAPVPGRIYEVEYEYEVRSVNGGVVRVRVRTLDAAYATIGFHSVTGPSSVGVHVHTLKISDVAAPGVQAWNASTVHLRAYIRLDAAGGSITAQMRRITVRDVTAREAATTSASAAANSASAAATSATNAGTSATAAQTSATNAATQAGSAQTHANNASTSATNAAGSASAASISAGAAANSATNAGASAGAASTSAGTASTKASEAATSASAAAISATTATTKAGEASTSATQASTSATTASGHASNAASSATNAATSATSAGSATIAGNSATSATGAANTATTKAGEASASASSAGTSAASANTSATNAGNSATSASGFANTASTKAAEAATSATSASGSATSASGSASAASTHASNAATFAGQANTAATTAGTQATVATNAAAAAQTSASVAAQIGAGSINGNPVFADWTTGQALPIGWSSVGAGYTATRVAGAQSPWALGLTQASSTATIVGVQTASFADGSVQTGGWYVLEVDAEYVSGDLRGAGVRWRWLNAAGTGVGQDFVSFFTDADITGATGNGTAGITRRWRKLVQVTNSNVRGWGLWALTRYNNMPGYVASATANAFTLHKVAFRPASDQEIAANKATADIATVSATVDTQTTALATLNSQYAGISTTVAIQGVTITSQADAITTVQNNVTTLFGRAGVTVDVNGLVTGWATNNNGSYGDFTVSANGFRIVNPSSGVAHFLVENGVAYLRGVEVDTIKAGAGKSAQTGTINSSGAVAGTGIANEIVVLTKDVTLLATGTLTVLAPVALSFGTASPSNYSFWLRIGGVNVFSVGGAAVALGLTLAGSREGLAAGTYTIELVFAGPSNVTVQGRNFTHTTIYT
ncbi:MAG: hypothetical protein AB7E60_01890 [Sphingobium sp.]